MTMINPYGQSLMILNTLNRNYLSMSRHMRRVTTGLRINSAADDPSGWAIGTRMQIEIRGLDQCSRNAQSSQSMIKVAEGSASSTIDILRTLKEKALEAANDTCTDISGFTISITDKNDQVRKDAGRVLDAFTETIQPRNASSDTSFCTQTGTKANQNMKTTLGDLRASALGLRGSDGSVINVSSREGATAAISVLDNAMSRALDQQTTIGAQSSRLDCTISNLTTQSENLTSAMSTIMDADMAKEMTEYTRDNILVQAAQAMLAQSNQNMGWFLSLLKS